MVAGIANLVSTAQLNVPWAEILTDPSTSDASWNTETSRVTMIIQVNAQKDLWSAIPCIIGYSQSRADQAGLKRTPPMFHPRYPNLRAVGITRSQDLGYVERTDTGDGVVGSYTRTNLHVVFQALNYPIVSDSDMRFFNNNMGEGNRYVETFFQSRTRYLASDRQAYQWSDGAAGSSTGKIKQGIPILVPEGTLQLVWHTVDERFITDTATGLRKNILACEGFVNSQTFFGYKPQTLLMEPHQVRPKEMALSPENLLTKSTNPPRCLDIVLNFKYLEPPTDTTTAAYGHNLFPDPASATGMWHRAVSVAGSAPLYQQKDFTQIFKGVGA